MTVPYKKGTGRDMKELFDVLHAFGVTTTGSMIFGLDHHTPEMLPLEAGYLASLYPSTAQFGSLIPAVGTELRSRLEREGRIRNTDYRESDLFADVLVHPNFKEGDLKAATLKAYDDLYEAIGPSIYRLFETWFTGYKNLRQASRPGLRRRADVYARRVRGLLPLFLQTQEYLPNDEIRRRVSETVKEVTAELGAPTVTEIGVAELYKHVFALEDAKRRHLKPLFLEPKLKVRDYAPCEAAKAESASIPAA